MTKEQLAKIYEASMESAPNAGADVQEANREISEALDHYCSALIYETFLWAYELGYNAGREAV